MSGEESDPEYIYGEQTLPEIIDVGISENFELIPSIPEDKLMFAKICTGLGNHEGGVVLLGVERDGNVCGLSNAEQIPEEVSEILEEFTEPVPQYRSQVESYGDEDIVVLHIEKHSHIPHAVTWEEEVAEGEKETRYGFYQRRDILQRQLGPYEIWRLMPEAPSHSD